MRQDNFDVVIIGGGIVGVSAAYFLAKAGTSVCIVEKGVVGGEASGRCAGGIGQSHRTPDELPLVMRAVQLWKQFSADAEIDFEYRQHGNHRLAWSEQDVQIMKEMVAREQSGGLDCQWLDIEETQEIAPYIQEGSYFGSVYTPSDGSADPYLACLEIATQAQRKGAMIYEHCQVNEVTVENGRVTGVVTDTGSISAGVVVNAANAWAPRIKTPLGIKIPSQVCRSHILITEELPPFIGPFTSCNRYGYFRQSLSGNVLMGYQSQPVDHWERRVAYDAIKITTRRFATIVPRLRDVSIIRAFTGFTVWSPDYKPFLGPLQEPEGLVLAAIFSGLGFAVGPAIGELVAECALGVKTTLSIEKFDPYRFEGVDIPEGFTGSSWQGI